MMRAEADRSHMEAFARAAQWRKQERALEQDRARDRKKQQDRADNDGDFVADTALLALATPEQVEAFNDRLDYYDGKIADALLRNEERLAAARDEERRLLERAYIGPDGRRVFATRDGERVFDESGAEIVDGSITAAEIGPSHPYWDDLQPVVAYKDALVAHREDLLGLQQKTADGRELSAQDGVQSQELDDYLTDLDAEFTSAMSREPTRDARPDVQPEAQSDEPAPVRDQQHQPGISPGF